MDEMLEGVHRVSGQESEALGLNPNHLKDTGCVEGLIAIGHYYPECPQDDDFLTVLLQDHIGGLPVLRDNQWVMFPLPL
ncbi:hypothetical protein Vadar_020256 [Vaccinium darrowii]|uniref:Uncharacterized protein n=1 Tax=Vaccinium darrowii TaxID=229202 RepID=A0ACB7YZ36_9ERIC|nr:hypothetical protein Vadar_020256 [Vaccinium darrowii]